jgi:hypothetical protein
MMIILGAGYSVFASVIWPSVPLTVDDKAVATAFGVVFCIYNF